jgi:hypothetical protein
MRLDGANSLALGRLELAVATPVSAMLTPVVLHSCTSTRFITCVAPGRDSRTARAVTTPGVTVAVAEGSGVGGDDNEPVGLCVLVALGEGVLVCEPEPL